MKPKLTWIHVTTAIILCTGGSTNYCNAQTDTVPASMVVIGGGQPPPNVSGGPASFTIRVRGSLPQFTAEALRTELVNEGFTAAKARPAGNGNFEVIISGLGSRAQADTLLAELKASGYTPDSIIEESAGTTAAPAAASSGDAIYRVLVAEFPSAEEANEASKILVDDGFVNVDVLEENGKHLLMLGTFNRRADAEALLTDVNRAGFALAEVVSRERLRPSEATALADADLSGLPAGEQQQTRDLLAMAEKVESGEASADEIKRLRESIQQLSENQKAILGRQESNRSADRDKLQRIFQLYRDFDQALKTRDLTAAEQALAEVKQIDPNEMFLANRIQALEQARSNGSTAGTGAAAAVDPAEVQSLLNQARSLESGGKSSEAISKYRQVLAMDPANVEARGKIADLDAGPQQPAASDQADGIAGLMQNKPLLYGGAALIALVVILLLWMKSRKRSAVPAEPTPTTGVTSFSMGSGSVDPLAGGTATSPLTTNPGGSALGGSTALAGAGTSGFADMHGTDEEEEEEPERPPVPARTPAPATESDTVSFEEFSGSPATPAPAPAASVDDEMVSMEPGEDTITPGASAETKPAAASSSMDADLEALLKGTFQGATGPEDSSVGVPAPAAATAEPSVVLHQTFDDEPSGSSPAEWRGEYDYASLTVANLGEQDHAQALKYEKLEAAGSATYHLGFPPARGRVTAEFDIRCDEKNKFLLGIYLERDEDFKQSIHTIIHQLDPNAPASLRLQGEAVPYQMGAWSHVRFEADLDNGTLDCFMDNEHVVHNIKLPVVPEYVNTLSIRDNLATTGTLYMDNIRIMEA